jgi:hypothetical protein
MRRRPDPMTAEVPPSGLGNPSATRLLKTKEVAENLQVRARTVAAELTIFVAVSAFERFPKTTRAAG